MSDAKLIEIRNALREFATERDWDRFHSPKNLASAVASEAGELLAHFRWLSDEQSSSLDKEMMSKVKEEVADTFIFLVRLSDKLGIDLIEAAREKIEINRNRYPAEKVRGSSKKYSEY